MFNTIVLPRSQFLQAELPVRGDQSVQSARPQSQLQGVHRLEEQSLPVAGAGEQKSHPAAQQGRDESMDSTLEHAINPVTLCARTQILHFFNTPPGLAEEQLLQLFNEKEVPPTAVRMFPLKTERSSSGLIEFSNVAEAVLAIMKCNHIPIESKGMSE